MVIRITMGTLLVTSVFERPGSSVWGEMSKNILDQHKELLFLVKLF